MSGANADAYKPGSTSFRRTPRKQCAMTSYMASGPHRDGRGMGARSRMNGRHLSCLDGGHQHGSASWRADLQTPVAAHPNGSNHMKKLLRISGARIAQLGEPPAILDDTD